MRVRERVDCTVDCTVDAGALRRPERLTDVSASDSQSDRVTTVGAARDDLDLDLALPDTAATFASVSLPLFMGF